jgi:hypothetical protein
MEPDRGVVVRDRRRKIAARALRDAAVVVDDGAIAFVVAVRGEQRRARLDLPLGARGHLRQASLLVTLLLVALLRAGRRGECGHQHRRECEPQAAHLRVSGSFIT